MKTLTIFTPAYNRAHTLERTYKSLYNQSCDDFEWLIVDDGSTDGTREIVESWIQEDRIKIRYIYQENQGMHGAHNTAYHNISTELNTCIDSDDWMPRDAVLKIISFWKKNCSNDYAGIVGLDMTAEGKIIGTQFTSSSVNLTQFYDEGGQGDKKIVYRTEVVKQYPDYPLFAGEKYVSLASKYFMIDQDYKLLTLNEPLVIVEYQQDGSSFNMWTQYWKNPQGFIYDRKLVLSTKPKIIKRFKYCIHYISSKLIAKQYDIISDSPCKVSTFLMLPFGYALYCIIKRQVKKERKMNFKR